MTTWPCYRSIGLVIIAIELVDKRIVKGPGLAFNSNLLTGLPDTRFYGTAHGVPSYNIDETLTNESNTEQHLMWGHHIAFGLPFLNGGASIETSASRFVAEEKMPSHRIFRPGIVQDWPMVATGAGGKTDASKIVRASEGKFSDLAYLNDFKNRAYYKLTTDQMSFTVEWDKSVFKSLWYWQERYATQDSPWWGKTFAVALEPWTNNWSENPTPADLEKDWLKLDRGQVLKTSLKTICEH